MKNVDPQKLLDIMVEVTMMVHNHKYFKGKDTDEIGDYIREQLHKCGIKTVAMGMSHAYLVDEYPDGFKPEDKNEINR
jgi:hypothetical protein